MLIAAHAAPAPQASHKPTFYKNVLPILQDHCQTCHRPGGIAPMPLVTYLNARNSGAAIKQAVVSKQMPPWFADPRYGKFSNDPSLTPQQIALISNWVAAGAPAGSPNDAPPPKQWAGGWNIPPPDKIVQMPVAVAIPAHGDVEYTYEIVPTGFAEDKWVQFSEIRPSSAQYVHHAVVYIRPSNSNWLRPAPVGVPFTASSFSDPKLRAEAHETTTDMLLVYAPGSEPDRWPDGVAKFIPAGSDLVFQMHYTANGTAGSDQTSVGMVFAKRPPEQRVLTLQLTNHSFIIPPRTKDYRVDVWGTMPNDCTLLSFFPHMHLRGQAFEYNILNLDGTAETLLRVNHYHFHWQLSYRLAEPRFLKAGTKLQAVAWYDNTEDNPHNPDPNVEVRWGGQTYEEMMVGFFDVAVPANVDKEQFFMRRANVK
ncbi:MAG TPA: thiol-disulfide isomerase [Candidatus Bathyarchaeia archaeon]|nr:thiol-disulfide isomerase [Candidatus Bathyarchaeia archaeon]